MPNACLEVGTAMRRRDFMKIFGGAAAAWPIAASAQQAAMPTIGLLNGAPFDAYADRVAAFRQGLREIGFIEGRNVAIEYRSADGRYDRLPELAADLVRRQVAVIVAIGAEATPRAAKTATSTIPIVFVIGADALASGLVKSYNRPEANVTGISSDQAGLVPKRVQLMRELLPADSVVAYLSNLSNRLEVAIDALKAVAPTLGVQLVFLDASTEQDIDAAFASMAQQRVAGLVVSADAAMNAHRGRIIALAARHAIPASYSSREYVLAGGLMSYGAHLYDRYRQGGVYAGRLLKGERLADLPVQQPTKFELLINLKTAKALGLDLPPTLLARADEVIE